MLYATTQKLNGISRRFFSRVTFEISAAMDVLAAASERVETSTSRDIYLLAADDFNRASAGFRASFGKPDFYISKSCGAHKVYQKLRSCKVPQLQEREPDWQAMCP